METLRPRTTGSQTAVDHDSLSSYPATRCSRAKGQCWRYRAETRICPAARRPAGFHNFWCALDEIFRDFPQQPEQDSSSNSAGTNGVNADPTPCEFQGHRLLSAQRACAVAKRGPALRCTSSRMGLRYCSRSRLPRPISARPSATTKSTLVTPMKARIIRIQGS
jgi:hypothetical protein